MVGIIAPNYNPGAAGVVSFGDQSFSGYGVANFKFEADGDISRELADSAGFTDVADWITPKPPGSGYQVRATLVSWAGGSIPGGTFGTWLAMSSDNSWGQSAYGSSGTSLITIEIRHGTGPVLDAATITLTVADGSVPPP